MFNPAQSSKLGALNLKEDTKDFVSCVVNPFNSDRPCRVPDLATNSTLCFRDNLQYSNPQNPAGGANGFCIWLDWAWSNYKNNYSPQSGRLYSLNAVGISDAGELLFDANNNYFSFETQNYEFIYGSKTGIDQTSSIVTSSRLVASGLRVLPQIETVTDTSQPYVSYYTAGLLSPAEFNAAVTNGSDVRDLLRNKADTQIYGNSDGCMVRYDPFQTKEQLDFRPLSTINGQFNARDEILMPVIIVTLSKEIAQGDIFPIIINLQIWQECVLKQPTPLYSTPSPVDPLYDHLVTIMSNAEPVFPIVTKGHSFKKFMARLNQFKKHVVQKHGSIAHLIFDASRIYNYVTNPMSLVEASTKHVRNQRRRKKQRANRRAGNTRRPPPRRRGARLAGNKPPMSKFRPVKNY